MRTFFTIWAGQLISLLGSQLTGFALGVWVYEQTHSVSMLALVQVAMQVPFVVLSPIAGVLADRWNRRTARIISDFGVGLSVLAVAVLFMTHHLEVWMVIPINLWMASFQTLIWPSFSAATTLLVPKEHYGRASGFTQLCEALPAIAGHYGGGQHWETGAERLLLNRLWCEENPWNKARLEHVPPRTLGLQP
jgi:MFS family permease